jgi:2-oxoglutarate ferredoxin oxidoreductase subunit alpha
MTPVMLLSDGYIANGAEPWLIPNVDELVPIPVTHPGPLENDESFEPYQRDEKLARPWAIPGTPGLMHRVGGLEKEDGTGNVSYDPNNHQNMTNIRAQKIENIAKDIPPQTVLGPDNGDLLVLSWGGTYGSCMTAVNRSIAKGMSVAHAHLRYLNPFPANLQDLLSSYRRILIPELNAGQLRSLIRSTFLMDAVGLNKVQGKPFSITEIESAIQHEIDTLSSES